MKISILTLILSIAGTFIFGQSKIPGCEQLSRQEVAKLFTDSLNQELQITFPIFKVFKCKDKTGQFYIVLTESNDLISPDQDTLNTSIKAFNFYKDNSGYIKKWELFDFKTRQAVSDEMESSIWFWSKYAEFKDIDHDNEIDPVIIYGTSGMNGTEDGRIKIFIFYKGQKHAIRHQNGVLDFERNTKVNKTFYSLPVKIQDHVKQIMEKLTDDGHAIFPYGWQTAMKEEKLFFDENKK
ncbi:MAG TPA: hypothetical protein PLU49_15030 [Saprospiraceae bacterium]|nr:hypothetical protein [Saprospirales bacterium]HRQ31393.1 hypothetical protein [Saprospiraceae bacterium]